MIKKQKKQINQKKLKSKKKKNSQKKNKLNAIIQIMKNKLKN